MFTIQYEAPISGAHKMQNFDTTSRQKLLIHLSRFNQPIVAVYEQATPITKAVRSELKTWPGTLSKYAREFTS